MSLAGRERVGKRDCIQDTVRFVHWPGFTLLTSLVMTRKES